MQRAGAGAAPGIVLYEKAELPRFRADKVDADLYDAVRLVVDVGALAQLVEGCVLFDGLLFDKSNSGFISRGLRKADPNAVVTASELPESLAPLQDIVRALTVRIGTADVALDASIARMRLYAASKGFADYLRLLAGAGLDGAFMRMSNRYFGTGFSDELYKPTLSYAPDGETMPEPQDMTAEAQGIHPMEWEKTLRMAFLLKDAREERFRVRKRIFDRNPPHILSALPYADTSDFGWREASGDVLRAGVAAFYYDEIAAIRRCAYLPHPTRAPILTFGAAAEHASLSCLGARSVRAMEAARSGRMSLAFPRRTR